MFYVNKKWSFESWENIISKMKLWYTVRQLIVQKVQVKKLKPLEKDIVKNQKSRFAVWRLIFFAARFHIIVLNLHFVVINAFIQFYFSYLYLQGRYKSYFVLLWRPSSSGKVSLIFQTAPDDLLLQVFCKRTRWIVCKQ